MIRRLFVRLFRRHKKSYREAVLAEKPVRYYRMEMLEESRKEELRDKNR